MCDINCHARIIQISLERSVGIACVYSRVVEEKHICIVIKMCNFHNCKSIFRSNFGKQFVSSRPFFLHTTSQNWWKIFCHVNMKNDKQTSWNFIKITIFLENSLRFPVIFFQLQFRLRIQILEHWKIRQFGRRSNVEL